MPSSRRAGRPHSMRAAQAAAGGGRVSGPWGRAMRRDQGLWALQGPADGARRAAAASMKRHHQAAVPVMRPTAPLSPRVFVCACDHAACTGPSRSAVTREGWPARPLPDRQAPNRGLAAACLAPPGQPAPPRELRLLPGGVSDPPLRSGCAWGPARTCPRARQPCIKRLARRRTPTTRCCPPRRRPHRRTAATPPRRLTFSRSLRLNFRHPPLAGSRRRQP